MPTEREWREAYNYLLSGLQQTESDSSLILEIQQAATVRVEADLVQDELMQLQSKSVSRVVREELDLARFRAPTPREAFIGVIRVLITRLREVPTIAERLQELFKANTKVYRSHTSFRKTLNG